MIGRRLTPTVRKRLEQGTSVVLLGPRQVGKTTLARNIADLWASGSVYLDLERPADQRRLTDADSYLRSMTGTLVVIDEIHRAPEIFAILRGVIDDRRRSNDNASGFLLLGSAALDLLRQSTESLAGRVSYLELSPLVAEELPSGADIDALWLRGGYPLSYLADSDESSLTWRRDFIRSYVERDVPMFAPRMPAESVSRLWGMLAHSHGTLLNQARLASSLGVSSPAVSRHIDLLVDLFMVRKLRPWSGNIGKRLVRSPKVWIRDSGMLHALLDIESQHDLLGHPVAGPSWEGFVIESLIASAGERRTPFFYRTADGSEIDLVFERGGRPEIAIEVKRSSAPELSRGFHIACNDLGVQEAFVVHGGDGEWSMGNCVTASSLMGMVQRLEATA